MENKIEISMSAYGALLANQHNVKDTKVYEEGEDFVRTTCQVHGQELSIVSSFVHGVGPVTRFYLTGVKK
ncbi:MAG: hypothetical protein GY918_14150 [Gammaproteobacteria bacterium]|nr:hypothetical protein [Gammaproteobacteria bacterium]